jgi:ComF family protein
LFDRTTAAFTYGFPIDAMIHALKYERRLDVGAALGAELARAGVHASLPDVVIAVPLSRSRLLERGFNQAHEVAKAAKLKPRAGACIRIRETPPQALLPWKERAKNVRGAFACEVDLSARHVAIVDDVMTTGATLNELAKVVKKAGAREVSCWVVARTLKS